LFLTTAADARFDVDSNKLKSIGVKEGLSEREPPQGRWVAADMQLRGIVVRARYERRYVTRRVAEMARRIDDNCERYRD